MISHLFYIIVWVILRIVYSYRIINSAAALIWTDDVANKEFGGISFYLTEQTINLLIKKIISALIS